MKRALLWRVGGAAVAISAILGAVTYFTQRDEVGEAVLAYARQRIELFNAESNWLLNQGMEDSDEVQRAIDEFRGRRPSPEKGRFVFVRLYDIEERELAVVAEEGYEHLDSVEQRLRPALHAGGREGLHEVANIGGVPHIFISTPLLSSDGRKVGTAEGAFKLSPAAVAAGRRRVLRTVLYVIGVVGLTALLLYPIIMELVHRLTRASADLLHANLETLQILGSAVAKRDTDTEAHSFRVTILAVRLAETLGLSDTQIRQLIRGAFLHDVGKIAIEDKILLKPGRLTDEEFEVMKTHVDHGVDIVRRSAWLERSLDIVASHHEHFDGTGYTEGLEGEGIPLVARIFAIVDVFDAVTSKRPYHEPRTLDETMELLRSGSGSHFDPHLLEVFSTIAQKMYDHLAGRQDERLRQELAELMSHYYSGGLDTLEA